MTDTVLSLPAKSLLVSKLNTRKPTAQSVADLATSIAASGQITPVIARPGKKDGTYEIAAGARRATACKSLGIDVITIVRDIPDDVFEDMILTDNLQREDPEPRQEAKLIKRRLDAGASIAEISARYGKPESWVRRRMKLLTIIPDLENAISENFQHFTTVMLEFLGSLPEPLQQTFADQAFELDDVKTLDDLRRFVSDKDCSLKDVFWLDDPSSFVPGCGPGCAHSSDNSLFKDEADHCSECLNKSCFFARRTLAYDEAITAALNGQPISGVVVYNSKSYHSEREYKGDKLKVIGSFDFNDKYTIVKKPADAIGLDLEYPYAAHTVHLRIKAKYMTTAGGGAPQAQNSRIEKLQAKRSGHVVNALITYVDTRTWEAVASCNIGNAMHLLIHLINAFGSNHRRAYITDEWDFPPIDDDCESLWLKVRDTLTTRLNYSTLGETLKPHYQNELAMLAKLTAFDLPAAEKLAAETHCPKWIKAEGYDNYSLEPR